MKTLHDLSSYDIGRRIKIGDNDASTLVGYSVFVADKQLRYPHAFSFRLWFSARDSFVVQEFNDCETPFEYADD